MPRRGRKRRLTKKKGQRLHAQQRAAERYETDYNRSFLRAFQETVLQHQELIIESKKLSNRTTYFWFVQRCKDYKIIYDKQRKEIATFLPMEATIEDLW